MSNNKAASQWQGNDVDDHVKVLRFHGPLTFFNCAILKQSVLKISGINPALKKKVDKNIVVCFCLTVKEHFENNL